MEKLKKSLIIILCVSLILISVNTIQSVYGDGISFTQAYQALRIFLGNFNISLIPKDDDACDLGSSTKEMKDVYIDGVLYVDEISYDSLAKGDLLAGSGTDEKAEIVSASGKLDGDVLTLQADGSAAYETPTSGDVTAGANLTDNAIVRGDDGAKGIQTSEIYVDDNNNLGIGTTSVGTSGVRVLVQKAGTAPTTAVSDSVQRWAEAGTEIDSDTTLVLHFTGDAADTTTTDSANGHTATATGNVKIWDDPLRFGTISDFDGTGDYWRISDHSDFDCTTSFTVDMWVYPDALSGNYFTKGDWNTSGVGYWMGFYLNKWHVNRYNGGAGAQLNSTDNAIDSTWTHVALTWDGTNGKLWIDGSLVDTNAGWGTNKGDFDSSADVIIGAYGEYNNHGYDFDGKLDEIRFSKHVVRYTDTFDLEEIEYGALAEARVMDGDGNTTTESPHNFSLIPSSKIKEYEFPWSYNSINKIFGKHINADLYGALKELEELSELIRGPGKGKKFIYIEDIPIKDLSFEEEEKLSDWVKEKRRQELERREAIRAELEAAYIKWLMENPGRPAEPDDSDTGIIIND